MSGTTATNANPYGTIRITGMDAVEVAEIYGIEKLCKLEDAIEDARDDLSLDEAATIASDTPELIFIELPRQIEMRNHGDAVRIRTFSLQFGWVEFDAIADRHLAGASWLVFPVTLPVTDHGRTIQPNSVAPSYFSSGIAVYADEVKGA